MPRKEPDDARVVRVRLPDTLLQRLDRSLDWRAGHRRVSSTRHAAIREAGSAWLDQQEQLAGRLQPPTLRRQCQATYHSIRPHHDGVPLYRLRELLRWPRERFDAVLEALRADQQVELEVLKDNDLEAQARQDSYHVHGQLYGRVRWRSGAGARSAWAPSPHWPTALAACRLPRYHRPPLSPTVLTPA